jgi:hypothetical protein
MSETYELEEHIQENLERLENDEEATEVYNKSDIFVALNEALNKKMKDIGFEPEEEPPGDIEKYDLANISEMEDKDLKVMYDKYLAHYAFLSDQITSTELYLGTAKERANTVKLELVKEVTRKGSEASRAYSNAEGRKAWVETHPAYLMATYEYLYFKQLHAAFEEMRRKTSKIMERVYREQMERNPTYSSGRQFDPTKRKPIKGPTFTKVRGR